MLLDEILILGADAIVEGPDVIVEGPDVIVEGPDVFVERPVSILFPAATGAKTGALEEEETGRGGLKGFMI
jgi:hypothetical protein